MNPKVSFERIQEDFEGLSFNNQGMWKTASSIQDALKNADAVLILTAWDDFLELIGIIYILLLDHQLGSLIKDQLFIGRRLLIQT